MGVAVAVVVVVLIEGIGEFEGRAVVSIERGGSSEGAERVKGGSGPSG